MVTQAAFHGPPRIVVLHPVANKCLQPAIIHFNRNFDSDFSTGCLQKFSHTLRHAKMIGRAIKIQLDSFEGFHRGRFLYFGNRRIHGNTRIKQSSRLRYNRSHYENDDRFPTISRIDQILQSHLDNSPEIFRESNLATLFADHSEPAQRAKRDNRHKPILATADPKQAGRFVDNSTGY